MSKPFTAIPVTIALLVGRNSSSVQRARVASVLRRRLRQAQQLLHLMGAQTWRKRPH